MADKTAVNGFNQVHSFPGVITSNPAPTAEGDLTSVEPHENEIRCDGTNIYVATSVVPATSVVWKKLAIPAWA